jgi:hypothetical protein
MYICQWRSSESLQAHGSWVGLLTGPEFNDEREDYRIQIPVLDQQTIFYYLMNMLV